MKIAALVLIGLGVSGFCAIAYQIIWTRLLILIIDNSVYSFTIILMGFLAGIAPGSLLITACFRFLKSSILLFAIVEICIGVSAFCFPFFIHPKPSMPDLFYLKFLFSTLPLGILLPTVFMGIAFPVGTRIYQRFSGDIGGSIGLVYAVNTAGCVLGGHEKVKEYEESVLPFLVNISDDEATREKIEDVIRYSRLRGNR